MIVVAGVDDSPMSVAVANRAIEEARWRGDVVHLVHVTHLQYIATDVPVNWEQVAEAERISVWAGLAEVIDASDVPIERVDLDGYPADALVTHASAVDASLLVVGTRGRGEFASLILGSTSHRAIHLAQCDVLVVKPSVETG